MIVAGCGNAADRAGGMVRIRTLLETVRGWRYSHEHVFAHQEPRRKRSG
jgi:hypothetical protein